MPFLILAIALISLPIWAMPHRTMTTPGIPVYLKPSSPVTTGHYAIDDLQTQVNRQQTLNWVQLKTKNGLSGWTLRDNLLTSLDFSSRANLVLGGTLYSEPGTKRVNEFDDEVVVDILKKENGYYYVSYKGEIFLTTSQYLYPVTKDPGYFYNKTADQLRAKPLVKSQHLAPLPKGTKLKPVRLVREWAQVEYKGKNGFLPIKNLVSRLDIAMKVRTKKGFVSSSPKLLKHKVYEIFVDPLWMGSGTKATQLYRNPSKGADVIAKLKPWSNSLQQHSITQVWNRSLVKDLGNIWWKNNSKSDRPPKPQKLSRHSIRKMIKNPLFSRLRFASANGLFRSTDGQTWTAIQGFEKTNPAFTFSSEGVLFVNDKVSYDNGENFSSYIRWEKLLNSLRSRRITKVQNLKIKKIETMNKSSDQLILELDIGRLKPIKVYTADRGRTWSPLTF